LADALDLGSSAARRAGSSPVPGTRFRHQHLKDRGPSLRSGFRLRAHARKPAQVRVLFPAPGFGFRLPNLLQHVKRDVAGQRAAGRGHGDVAGGCACRHRGFQERIGDDGEAHRSSVERNCGRSSEV
jgi:hypothetical protein